MNFLKEKIKTVLCLDVGWFVAIHCVTYLSGMLALTLFMILKYIGV